jgi:large subunit ribosomal protein L17
MRHGVKGRKLGRTTAHREALFRNQLQSLVEREKIVTTLPKAKELRPIAEKVITRGKHGTVYDRRWVLRWVLKRDLVKKVFDEIAPRFQERPGGYLRIVKLGPRQGDGAEMAVLELVERGEAAPAEPPKETKAKKAPKPKKEAKDRPKPKRESKGETKKVHTHKEGKSQTSAPKKIGT